MTIHEAAIRLLRRDYPNLQTRGFRRSVCALEIVKGRRESSAYPDLLTYVQDVGDDENAYKMSWQDYAEWGEPPKFKRIPDGYFLDFYCQMAVVFEVEDTSPLTIQKLDEYYELYLEHIDPLGWGLAIVSVSRWGKRTPVPFFDYVFSEMIEDIPDQSLLKAMQASTKIEHKYSEAVCDSKWLGDEDRFKLISESRLQTDHEFWQSDVAMRAFEKVMRER